MDNFVVFEARGKIVERPEWTPLTLGLCTDMWMQMSVEQPERARSYIGDPPEFVIGTAGDEHSVLFFDPSYAPVRFMELMYPLLDPLRAELTVDDVRELDGFTQQRILQGLREAQKYLSPYGVRFCQQRFQELATSGVVK